MKHKFVVASDEGNDDEDECFLRTQILIMAV